MIPTIPADHTPNTVTDDATPRFFLDDTFDSTADGDWWLDLGHIDLPTHMAV